MLPLLLTPNKILKKTENRDVLSVSECQHECHRFYPRRGIASAGGCTSWSIFALASSKSFVLDKDMACASISATVAVPGTPATLPTFKNRLRYSRERARQKLPKTFSNMFKQRHTYTQRRGGHPPPGTSFLLFEKIE